MGKESYKTEEILVKVIAPKRKLKWEGICFQAHMVVGKVQFLESCWIDNLHSLRASD